MKIPKELTTVTLLSKSLALVVFLIVPVIAFALGVEYQQTVDFVNQEKTTLQVQTSQTKPLPAEASAKEGTQTPSLTLEATPSAQMTNKFNQ